LKKHNRIHAPEIRTQPYSHCGSLQDLRVLTNQISWKHIQTISLALLTIEISFLRPSGGRPFNTLLCNFLFVLVRGFVPAVAENRQPVLDLTAEQEKVRELTQRKQNLILELNNYHGNDKVGDFAEPNVLPSLFFVLAFLFNTE